MVAADRDQVAVAAEDDDLQLRVRQLEPGGEGDRAAVRGVERVELEVARRRARCSRCRRRWRDAPRGSPLSLHRLDEGVDAGADAAGRAPDVRHPVRRAGTGPSGDAGRSAPRSRPEPSGGSRSRLRVGSSQRLLHAPRGSPRARAPRRRRAARAPSAPAPPRSAPPRRAIWPRLISGTTKPFTRAASSRMRSSGNGQTVISRSTPTFSFRRARQLDRRARDPRA